MSLLKKIANRSHRRGLRVKSSIVGNLPRVSVFRSLNHIYAQIIDDNAHKTLVSCSSLELKDLKGDKKAIANSVGLELAKRALEKGIESVKFDRGPFLYHGRVQSVADGLRKGGLKV